MNSPNSRFGARFGVRPECDSCRQAQNPAFFRQGDAVPFSQGTHASRSLAMAYVPNQCFENLFEVSAALDKGTIFQDLNFPFYGGNFRCDNCKRR